MRFVNVAYEKPNPGHYSPGVISHGMLYVSGQLSINPDTREVCLGDIRDHMQMALSNVDRVLRAAPCRRDQVVSLRITTTDSAYWPAINECCAEFFGSHKPARIITTAPSLHFGCLVEIEAIAEMES